MGFFFAQLESKADADARWQAHESDGSDVLIVGQVLSLAIDSQPRSYPVADAEVELGITVIEIAIGQEQAITAVDVVTAEEVRIVGTADKS